MSLTTDGRTLPHRVVGRAVRPYAFAVSLATSVSVWSVATDRAVGELLDGLPGEGTMTFDPEIPEVKPLPEKATKG